jgi:carbamate kinase
MDSNNRPTAIVAMGGHAFMLPGEKGTIDQHQRNAAEISSQIMHLVDRDYNLVVTHGNGPQVGNLQLMTELTGDQTPPMPLDVLVAMTQGQLGFILQQAILNRLAAVRIERRVVSVISQVAVDRDDPAFHRPTKPIGPFLAKDEAEKRREELGWQIIEDAGRGWRRVVPSPRPRHVIQSQAIADSVHSGHIVIACGGGGIPVLRKQDGSLHGVEAVIDKDLTSSVLGTQIGADLLIILTDVPNVFIHYGKPEEAPLGAVTVGEMEAHLKAGQFAEGSMGPKVQAILGFLAKGGKRGIITSPDKLSEALEGREGTHVVGRY